VNFFAYGSLIFDEVMFAVTGQRYRCVTATLSGFARYCVSGATYPGLLLAPDDSVVGVLYTDVSLASFKRLDRFEGEYYQRRSVSVGTDHETESSAETYVFHPEFEHLLSRISWDSENFRLRHLNTFLSSYQGFNWIDSH
jgi:gamma-glutamylcyclotransferase (GGCT)/AIG2-like uncharacterized protein YtfP